MNQKNYNFVRNVKRLYLLMSRHIEEELKIHGLARSQFQVMHYVHEERGLTQKVLQQKMKVEPATLTVIIDGLEKKDLLKRTESKTDKRVNILLLTEKGTTLRESIPSLHEIIEKRMFQGIAMNDQKVIKNFIDQMIKNLE